MACDKLRGSAQKSTCAQGKQVQMEQHDKCRGKRFDQSPAGVPAAYNGSRWVEKAVPALDARSKNGDRTYYGTTVK